MTIVHMRQPFKTPEIVAKEIHLRGEEEAKVTEPVSALDHTEQPCQTGRIMRIIRWLFRRFVIGSMTSNDRKTLVSSGCGEVHSFVKTTEGLVPVHYQTYRVRTSSGFIVDLTVGVSNQKTNKYKVFFPGATHVDPGCKGPNDELARLATENGENFISLNFPGAGTKDSRQIVRGIDELCDIGVEALDAICAEKKTSWKQLSFVGFSTGGVWAIKCARKLKKLFNVNIETTVSNTFSDLASVVQHRQDGSVLGGTGEVVRWRSTRRSIFNAVRCQNVVRASSWELDSGEDVIDLVNSGVLVQVIQTVEAGTRYEETDEKPGRPGCVLHSEATLLHALRNRQSELTVLGTSCLIVTEPGKLPHGGKNRGLVIRQAVAEASTYRQPLVC